MDGVFEDLEGFFLLVDGEGFVAGAKVEDAAFADMPNGAAAEVFSFVPVFFEDDFVGGWDVEGFVVHFSLVDVPFGGEAAGDGVFEDGRAM